MRKVLTTIFMTILLFAGFVHSVAAQDLFTGNLYRMGTDKADLLFRQFNEFEKKGTRLRIAHLYSLSDGTPYAIEEVYFENGEFESYRVEFYLLDTSGTIDRDGETITINYRAVNEYKSGTYPFQQDLMCGPCLVSYVHDNWERLMNGKSVRFHLPVMEYQRTIPFRFKKIRKSSYLRDGRVVLRMEIASFILGLLIGPVDFVFEEDSKRLVEIHGPSILRVEERGKWRSVKVDAYYTYERAGALQQVHLK